MGMNEAITQRVQRARDNFTETKQERKNNKFTIRLSPATKKNSQQIFNKRTKTGKLVPFIVPSVRFKNYQRRCILYMPNTKTITRPINIKAIYYMPTRRVVDITNLHSALHDVLVHWKVIEDDNCKIVVSTDGSRVSYSKESPRTEVEITDSDYVCWETKPAIWRDEHNNLPHTKRKFKRRVMG